LIVQHSSCDKDACNSNNWSKASLTSKSDVMNVSLFYK